VIAVTKHLALLALACWTTSTYAAERRCGWLSNPTPSNYFLTDRKGTWSISEQGGFQADGMENLPDFPKGRWIITNGSSYGYGCACMTVETDRETMRINTILSAHERPLKHCSADRALRRR
jgi:Protein of unknown function (DUF4087)